MPSWKKVIVSGSDANLNSLSVTQDVTAAGFSGSFSGSFQGDGSGLTGITAQPADPFPYTGSAIISGSLEVIGTLTATSIVETSSKRFKDNIEDLQAGLEHILKLRPVSFTRKDTTRTELGFIAEEVVDIIPQVVTLADDAQIQGIEYSRIVALLVKAIQELEHKLNQQTEEIKKLKSKLQE